MSVFFGITKKIADFWALFLVLSTRK